MTPLFQIIRQAYGGFSRHAWILAFVVAINRSGAMVMPFLAIYTTEVLHFNITQAGLILSMYGLGSVCGSVIGGWLTDRYGQFSIQFISQVAGGCLFFLLPALQQFEYLAAGVFVVSLVNDTFRPANAAAVVQYATPENMARAFSLNRGSINLGFMAGSILAGVVAAVSYKWLFIANGASSIIAGIFFFWYFSGRQGERRPLQKEKKEQSLPEPTQSPYRDLTFLFFVLLCCCFATIFYQLFSTLPLYYKQVYQLQEESIGLLMSLNGLVVLLVEMVLIYLLTKFVKKSMMIVAGVLLLGVSFMLFNIVQHISILVISMLLFSLSEILATPFMPAITAERSGLNNRGAYMGLFNVVYAVPLVVAPFLGTTVVSMFGFSTLWWASGGMAVVTAGGLYIVVQQMEKQRLRSHTAIQNADEELIIVV